VELAIHHHARITLIHVLEPAANLAQVLAKASWRPQHQRSELSSPSVLEETESLCIGVRDALKADVLTELPDKSLLESVQVTEGKVAEVILRLSIELNMDLIVVGSHGPDTLGSKVLGSVTNKVLQLSNIPVLMVPMISGDNWRKTYKHVP